MGFWDDNEDLLASGGAYVGKDEKQDLMENGVVFPITGIIVEDSPKFGERYVATVVLPDEDGSKSDRLISFPKGTVESRDRTLDRMRKWLEDPTNEPPLVKLEKVGRSILVRPAA